MGEVFGNSSALMLWNYQWLQINVLSIVCSIKLINLDWAGFSHLGNGGRDLFFHHVSIAPACQCDVSVSKQKAAYLGR